MSANQGAIVALLAQKEIGYSIVQNNTGWCIELNDPIMGKDLEDLIKVTDTQSSNVIAAATPNVGLVVQTEGFEYDDEVPVANTSTGEDSAP